MSGITIRLGDAFLLRTPPIAHLFIAIAPTTKGKYLFVNVTTRKSRSETTCILKPGPDVPAFINRESIIAYRFAQELDADELSNLVMPGSKVPKGVVSKSVLKRIQEGGLKSKALVEELKAPLKAFLSDYS